MGNFFRKINILMVVTMLTLAAGPSWGASSTLFYTVGHQDDWQLFMNPNAFHDVRVADARVVFIYMTAGDAGWRTAPQGDQIVPYFRAREIGANEAVRFMATPSRIGCSGPGCYDAYGERLRSERVRINRRGYRVVNYLNTVSYFLRLPDGFPEGRRAEGSLQKLWQNEITELTDIQDRHTYTAVDLIATLEGIIRREAAGSSNVWINIPYRHATPGDGWVDDTYTTRDPDQDHSDHIYSGWFMFQAAKAFSCINRAEFYGYQTATMEPNLSLQQLIWEAGTWGATNSGLLRTDGARSTFNDSHNAWIGRNYFEAYQGAGPCTPESF